MHSMKAAGIAALAFMLAGLGPLSAQTVPQAGAPSEAATTPAPATTVKTPRRSRSTNADPSTKREPTAGQIARTERQRKCGAEWKEAKAAGKTGGLKWPQYWSQCNTRLKGSHV